VAGNIVLSKGVIFKQYIQKKYKYSGIQICKHCNMTSYTYNMNVYLGKDRQNSTQMITATHVTLRRLTRGVEGLGHKLYIDNSFSSPDKCHDLYTRGINCCGTVIQNCK
jgi:hypothetical protein